MRIIVNSNDRESGTTTDFTTKSLLLLPEDRNKTYKVYIKQVIIHGKFIVGGPSIDFPIIYLSSNNIIPTNGEYNTRYNNTLCFLRQDINDNFIYQNDGDVENFTIRGINDKINFSIHSIDADDTELISSMTFRTTIILNLVEC